MPFAIQSRYKPDSDHLRDAVLQEHIAFLDANKDRLLAAGGLIDDDGGGLGGIILMDTDDRAEAEALIAEDPYTKAGLLEGITVTRWRKSFFNFESLL